MTDYTWVKVALSFVVTWAIGLIPPLMIRFGFANRGLSRLAAGVSALGLYFFNVILFTVAGSQSRSHTALLLVSLVSYAIMNWATQPKRSVFAATKTNPNFLNSRRLTLCGMVGAYLFLVILSLNLQNVSDLEDFVDILGLLTVMALIVSAFAYLMTWGISSRGRFHQAWQSDQIFRKQVFFTSLWIVISFWVVMYILDSRISWDEEDVFRAVFVSIGFPLGFFGVRWIYRRFII